MSLPDGIARRIAAIAGDRDRGATELAHEALDVLRQAAETGGVEQLRQAGAALVRARPAMSAIKNAIGRVVADPAALAHPADGCRAARLWLDEASRLAIERAAAALSPDALVLTCSYSSAVVQACLRAASEHRIRVRAAESRFSHVPYGERVAARLRTHHVPCDVVSENRLADALAGVTLVLVGADRVLPGGALVNGSPSRQVALAAHAAGVPFYAICEAFKLDDERVMEPGLDLVPARLVTGYLTANGAVPPGQVWDRTRDADESGRRRRSDR